VVGGGEVAWRKIQSLLACQAEVVVVAPCAHPEIVRLAEEGRITWHRRTYQPEDLAGSRLVFALCDEAKVNEEISREADRRGIFANVAQGVSSSFFLPAVFRKGDLLISVSTSGKSPFLARKLRDWLASIIPQDIEELLLALSTVRTAWKGKNIPLQEKVREYERCFKKWYHTHPFYTAFFSRPTDHSRRGQ